MSEHISNFNNVEHAARAERFSRCPSCYAVSKITAAMLKPPTSDVHCDACHQVFNASQHLVYQDSNGQSAIAEPANAPTATSANRYRPEPAKTTTINMNGVDADIADLPNPLAGIFWLLVTAGFVILLGLQINLYVVDRFAQNAQYRPYLDMFCNITRCAVPPRQDAYRFAIIHTSIELHPRQPGALRITVKLLNHADFAQPFPELRLTLTDRVERVVGRRSFKPSFYLLPKQLNQLNAGELGTLAFDLAQPHEKAVGFVVDIVRKSLSG